MNIYFNGADGRIFHAVYDKDIFSFLHSTNIPLTTLTIDELDPLSKGLCFDLIRTVGRVDMDGENKYHINAQGALIELIDWVEAVYEII